MTERDKLIELLNQDNCPSPMFCSDNCKYVNSSDCATERLADHLLENGVIVLPVKVGDTIYKLGYTECHNGETHPDSYGCCGCYDECDMQKAIFEIVVPNIRFILDRLMDMQNNHVYFFTRKEAEKALNEQKK